MRIHTIDSSGYETEFDFSDQRLMMFDRALRELGINGARFGQARDGDPLFHSISQLAFLENEALTKENAKLQFEDLLGPCITAEAGPMAAIVNYVTIEKTGKGAPLSPSGDGMPMADVETNLVAKTIKEGGIGYSYTLHDLEVAGAGILPLPASKQEAAVDGYKSHMNDCLLRGEPASGFDGLFNNSTVPNGARPSGVAWTAATLADDIIDDLNAGMSIVYTNSKENHLVEMIAVPPSKMQFLNKRLPNSDYTILRFFLENNFTKTQDSSKNVRLVSGGEYLETAGTGDTPMAAFYTPNQRNIKAHVPMPIRFGAPQPSMNKLVVPSRYRYGGTNNRLVYASYFMYGL